MFSLEAQGTLRRDLLLELGGQIEELLLHVEELLGRSLFTLGCRIEPLETLFDAVGDGLGRRWRHDLGGGLAGATNSIVLDDVAGIRQRSQDLLPVSTAAKVGLIEQALGRADHIGFDAALEVQEHQTAMRLEMARFELECLLQSTHRLALEAILAKHLGLGQQLGELGLLVLDLNRRCRDCRSRGRRWLLDSRWYLDSR